MFDAEQDGLSGCLWLGRGRDRSRGALTRRRPSQSSCVSPGRGSWDERAVRDLGMAAAKGSVARFLPENGRRLSRKPGAPKLAALGPPGELRAAPLPLRCWISATGSETGTHTADRNVRARHTSWGRPARAPAHRRGKASSRRAFGNACQGAWVRLRQRFLFLLWGATWRMAGGPPPSVLIALTWTVSLVLAGTVSRVCGARVERLMLTCAACTLIV